MASTFEAQKNMQEEERKGTKRDKTGGRVQRGPTFGAPKSTGGRENEQERQERRGREEGGGRKERS